MNEFSITGENNNFIKVILDDVYGFPDNISHWGGYELRTSLKIKSGAFQVSTILRTSTGVLFELLQKIKECNQTLSGDVAFISGDHDLQLFLTYTANGHVKIEGKYSPSGELKNELNFEFVSDQSFMNSTIKELELIVSEYGDVTGIKK